MVDQQEASVERIPAVDGEDELDSPPPYALTTMPIPWAIEWKLYLSHLLSTWNSRMFEFGAVLFLAHIYPNTLLRLSIYAMVRSAIAIVLSPMIGRAIDVFNRMSVVRASIVVGRISVIVSGVIMFLLLSLGGFLSPITSGILFALAVMLACAEKCASILNLVSVERDWVVVIADGSEYGLQKLNARMRRIDLFCKLLGPFLIALIDGVSSQVAIWVVVGLNIVCLPIEWFAIARVYKLVWKLREPREIPTAEPTGLRSIFLTGGPCFGSLWNGLKIYFSDPAFLPSFSLSMLYLTVLSFGGQLVTFLIAAGFSSILVGVTRAVSTVFELSATWIAPRVMARVTPIRGAMWFISWQMICLLVTLIVFKLNSTMSTASAIALAVGTILSRVGLWGFDLCATTVIQNDVEDGQRGAFSATEAMFQNIFELVSYGLTIVYSKPEDFHTPVIISVVAVWIAGFVYAFFLKRRRGHLVHIPRLPCVEKRPDSPAVVGSS